MPLPGYRYVEENLRTAMSCFAASKPEGEAVDVPGLRLVFTGVPFAVFNAALLTEPVGTLTEFRRRLERARDFFERRRSPWSLWICEELMDVHVAKLTPSLVCEYGLQYSSHPPGMLAERLRPPQRVLPSLDCQPIDTPARRIDFCHVMSMAFEGPFAGLMEAYSSEEFWNAGFRGLIGYRDGRAITTACLVTSESCAGLYAVATIPAEQRKGYGEAVMRQVLAKQDHTGRVVLQSTASGISTYERMGFAHVADFTIYVSPAAT